MSDNESNPKPWLRPGDVIKYYSPFFIPGDVRALRTATIVSIDPDDDPSYPVKINRFEILPLHTLVSRTTTHEGAPCEPAWMALKCYNLLPGNATVAMQEIALIAGISTAVAAAVSATRKTVRGSKRKGRDRKDAPRSAKKQCEVRSEPTGMASGGAEEREPDHESNDGATSGKDNAAQGDDGNTNCGVDSARSVAQDTPLVRLEDIEAPPAIDYITKEEYKAALQGIPTAAEQRKKQRRGRDRLGIQQKSKKWRHQGMRHTTRDSKYVYNPRTKTDRALQLYIKKEMEEAKKESKAGGEDIEDSTKAD